MDAGKREAITLFNKVFVHVARQMVDRELLEWMEAYTVGIINSEADWRPLDEALDWDIEEMVNSLELPE